jgi:hypothetical protein
MASSKSIGWKIYILKSNRDYNQTLTRGRLLFLHAFSFSPFATRRPLAVFA